MWIERGQGMTKRWIAEAVYGIMTLLFVGICIGTGKESKISGNEMSPEATQTPNIEGNIVLTSSPVDDTEEGPVITSQVVLIQDKMEIVQKPELLPEPDTDPKEEGNVDVSEAIDGEMPGAIDIVDENYNQYSNEKYAWWFSRKKEHQPSGSGEEFSLTPFSAAYLNEDVTQEDQVIYITFDCGYENGFTPDILNVLAEKNVKATFFVTKNFVTDYPEYVKRMKEEGHMVGNHTVRHLSSPLLTPEELKEELREVAQVMEELTGYSMDPFFRPPMGEYSERVLKVVQDMGYSSVFWSIAYYDYDVNNQPGKEYVVNHFADYHHNGSIVLMHNTSRSNHEALGEVLELLEEEGYRFGTLSEIFHKE